MDDILRYQQLVVNDLEQYFGEQAILNPGNYWHADMLTRLEEFTVSGKLLRGSLLCFSQDIFGGTQANAARHGAVALELIHSALLIHDDIIDRDSLRRGRPSMQRQYQELGEPADTVHFGESMAICVADAAIFLGLEHLGKVDIPGAGREKLISLVSRVFTTVCVGQMLDINLGSVDTLPKKKDIVTIMEQKTAAYSLALPLAAGAIIAGRPDAVIKKLMELGMLLGIIFQIRDDELGIFGASSKTGKLAGSDIREGKKTLLQYYLLGRASGTERKRLLRIFGNQQASPADIDSVRQAMLSLQVPEAVQRDVTTWSNRATRFIDKLPLSLRHKADLHELLSFCAKRDV